MAEDSRIRRNSGHFNLLAEVCRYGTEACEPSGATGSVLLLRDGCYQAATGLASDLSDNLPPEPPHCPRHGHDTKPAAGARGRCASYGLGGC